MGSGVYVMDTFRAVFHIGREECVTCQVPASQVGVGAVKEEGGAREVPVGGRRRRGGDAEGGAVMVYGCMWEPGWWREWGGDDGSREWEKMLGTRIGVGR